MNFNELFQMQKALDERIVKEKGLEGQDLLPKKILALQTELGELANEWRGFKFWSKRQFPTNEEVHCIDDEGNAYYRNNLLEEYVDCLHFILSIGNELEVTCNQDYIQSIDILRGVIGQFDNIFSAIYQEMDRFDWEDLVEYFIGLGSLLGFTWEQIEQA